jgi:hypothetical protein
MGLRGEKGGARSEDAKTFSQASMRFKYSISKPLRGNISTCIISYFNFKILFIGCIHTFPFVLFTLFKARGKIPKLCPLIKKKFIKKKRIGRDNIPRNFFSFHAHIYKNRMCLYS